MMTSRQEIEAREKLDARICERLEDLARSAFRRLSGSDADRSWCGSNKNPKRTFVGALCAEAWANAWDMVEIRETTGGWTAFASLDFVADADGPTPEDAIKALIEAIEALIEAARESGEVAP